MNNEIANKFKNVDKIVMLTKLALKEMKAKDPERQFSAHHNVIVWGRSITFALQKLKTNISDFDNWYKPYVLEMSSDPLLKFFKNSRNELEKEAKSPISNKVHIKNFNTKRDIHRLNKPDAETDGFFMGDQLGGSGWIIKLPDGSREKYYIDIPSEIGTSSLVFVNSPAEHLGKDIRNKSTFELSEMYITYLESIVEDCKKKYLRV